MKDSRLEVFASANHAYSRDSIRIDHLTIEGYRFFSEKLELSIKGKNLLLYGENGTGKSSVYRALALLAGKDIATIAEERNIFAEEVDPEIEFTFSDGKTLILDRDTTEIPIGFEYLKPLALFMPLLDYKRLLKIHFSSEGDVGRINIYSMLRELFTMYPVKGKDSKLSDIRNFPEYFSTLETLMNGELLSEINDLICVFDHDFSIDKFEFFTEIAKDGALNPRISILIDYRDSIIEQYQSFLNEARLSALAISLYFASIRRLLEKTAATPFKILVLDDVLISLDMANRLKLLDILKTRFADFQIFLFTHDKELFDIYRDKMDWARYELYMDDSGNIPKAIVTTNKTEIEKAKISFGRREYDECAFHLRKGFEKLLKNNLNPAEQRNSNYEDLDLAGLISKLMQKSAGEVKAILRRLDSDRTHILNPLCHDDHRNTYSPELKAAIEDFERLAEILRH